MATGNLNIASNLHLGKAELSRLQLFLGDQGYKKALLQQSERFGFVKLLSDPSFQNFKVSVGSTSGTIQVSEGYAFNSLGQVIYTPAQDNIAVPSNGTPHIVVARYATSPLEVGTVSIDAYGNLTGVGTKFTEVLRGFPGRASKIRFYNSTSNTADYSVVRVINDTTAILINGSFVAETNLRYSVVGTFTSGASIPSQDKEPFRYDYNVPFTLSGLGLQPESTLSLLGTGIDFIVARVTNTSGTVVIEDKRNEIWQLKGEFDLERLPSYSTAVELNDLVGVEAIKFQGPNATKTKNIVELAFSFRSSNFTYNSTLNTLSILAGQGGRYKSTNDFVNGKFDNWLVYTSDKVKRARVVSSSKVSTQINLVLDVLDPSWFGFQNWSSVTTYSKGSKVTTSNATTWTLLSTSSLNEDPANPAQGSWSGLTTYTTGQVVLRGSRIFKAVTGSTNVDPNYDSGTYWSPVWEQYYEQLTITPDIEEIEFLAEPNFLLGKSTWLSTATYSIGSVVNYNGLQYTSLANSNTNNQPDTASTKWKLTAPVVNSIVNRTFPANTTIARMELEVFGDTSLYRIRYRYRNNKQWLPYQELPTDSVGYYTEASFDSYGNLGSSPTRYTYNKSTGEANILLTLSSNSYTNTINRIDTGNKLGIRLRDFTSLTQTSLVANFVVGTDEEYQYFKLLSGGSDPYQLTADQVFNLYKDPTYMKDGNRFVVEVKRNMLNLDGVNVRRLLFIQSNSLTPSIPAINDASILYEFNGLDFYNGFNKLGNGMKFEFVYDLETNSWNLL